MADQDPAKEYKTEGGKAYWRKKGDWYGSWNLVDDSSAETDSQIAQKLAPGAKKASAAESAAVLSGKGKSDAPVVEMTPEERAAGLAGLAAFNRRRKKALDEWTASKQAEALKQ
jgi:hypothetical protein